MDARMRERLGGRGCTHVNKESMGNSGGYSLPEQACAREQARVVLCRLHQESSHRRPEDDAHGSRTFNGKETIIQSTCTHAYIHQSAFQVCACFVWSIEFVAHCHAGQAGAEQHAFYG